MTVFRLLIVLNLACGVARAIVNATWPMAAVGAEDPVIGAISSVPFVVLLTSLLLGIAFVEFAAMIGLFFFQRWARRAAVWATALLLIAAIPAGPVSESGLASALGLVSAMTWGAVLALAYFGPASERIQSGANNALQRTASRQLS